MTAAPRGTLLAVGSVTIKKARRITLLLENEHIGTLGRVVPARTNSKRENPELIELWWMSEDAWNLSWLNDACDGRTMEDWDSEFQFVTGSTIPHRTAEQNAAVNIATACERMNEDGVLLSDDSSLDDTKQTLALYLANLFAAPTEEGEDEDDDVPELFGLIVDERLFDNPDSHYLLDELKKRTSAQVTSPWIFLTKVGCGFTRMPLRDYRV